jgi:hypothetical protein
MHDPSDLEVQVINLWGDKPFDWAVVRTTGCSPRDPAAWYWYCGSNTDNATKRADWVHWGQSASIAEALKEMVKLGEQRLL